MYKEIFYKELIGKKRIFFAISLVFLFTYIIIAFSIQDLEQQLNKNNIPDAEYNGIIDASMHAKDLTEIKNYIEQNEDCSDIKIVPCMNLTYLTMSSGPLYSIDLDVNAFKEDYINENIKPMLSDGRIPQNSKEILVGNYFLKYFDLKLGDSVGKNVLYHNGEPLVYLHLDIDRDFDINNLEDYKIVGVIDNNYYKFSVIRIYEDNYVTNRLLFYFKSREGYEEFENLNNDNNFSIMKQKLVGGQSIYYNLNNKVSLISKISIEIVIIIVILLLILLYITKGMKKKVGVLKSLGISDKVIIKIFASNFLYLLLLIDVVSIAMIFLIFNILNSSINDYYGFVLNTYKLSTLNIIVNICFTFITYISLVACIKLRTIKTTPKNSILRG